MFREGKGPARGHTARGTGRCSCSSSSTSGLWGSGRVRQWLQEVLTLLWSPGSSPAQPAGPPGQRGAHPAEGPPGHHLGCDVGTCGCAGHRREGAAPHTSPGRLLDQSEGHVPVRRPEGRDGQRGGHGGALCAGEWPPRDPPQPSGPPTPVPLGDPFLTPCPDAISTYCGLDWGPSQPQEYSDPWPWPGTSPHPSSPPVWGSPGA